MTFLNEPSIQALAQYAYQPGLVYMAAVGMMLASSIGFPIPEEVTIVSLGLLSYIGAHPDQFPPPVTGAEPVNVFIAAFVCLIAVVFCDCLIFTIGRTLGRKVLSWGPVSGIMTASVMERVEAWTHKYGAWAVAIFRFTPGIRFPAHIILGMSKLRAWKFILIDLIAALISIPTQIFLIAHYGEVILKILTRFKLAVSVLILAALLFYAGKKLYSWFSNRDVKEAN